MVKWVFEGEGSVFQAWALYLSFETYYKFDFSKIHKYNISMLSHFIDIDKCRRSININATMLFLKNFI